MTKYSTPLESILLTQIAELEDCILRLDRSARAEARVSHDITETSGVDADEGNCKALDRLTILRLSSLIILRNATGDALRQASEAADKARVSLGGGDPVCRHLERVRELNANWAPQGHCQKSPLAGHKADDV